MGGGRGGFTVVRYKKTEIGFRQISIEFERDRKREKVSGKREKSYTFSKKDKKRVRKSARE